MTPLIDLETRKKWDLAIRAGQTAFVRSALRDVTRRRVPREDAAWLAQIAWRSGMPYLGLRLLARYVRPRSRNPEEAKPEEKAEYAACLIRVGAVGEALDILNEVSPARVPAVLLYRAFALVARWQYDDSIPVLKQYCASAGVPAYQKLVARVNLAAALVFRRESVKATVLLRDLLHEVSVRNLPLLTANTLELMSEHAILDRRFRDAEKGLQRADELLEGGGTIYAFLVTKWREILAFMTHQTRSLDSLRRLAKQNRHWETIRDCDRFTALRDRNEKVATHLYFGTPFEGYRRRLLSDFDRWFEPPASYLWTPGPRGADAPTVDLFSGDVSSAKEGFRRGQFTHRLLVILCGDFYRPARIPELHHILHPGEHYHPESSPLRFHQTARALRLAFEEMRLPLSLDIRAGTVRLQADGPVKIRILKDQPAGKPAAFEVEKLRDRWPDESFSTQDAVEALAVPRRSVQRILQTATLSGALVRTGSKGYTRYRFP